MYKFGVDFCKFEKLADPYKYNIKKKASIFFICSYRQSFIIKAI